MQNLPEKQPSAPPQVTAATPAAATRMVPIGRPIDPAPAEPSADSASAPPPQTVAAPLRLDSALHQGGQGTPVSFDLREADIRGVLRMLADVSGQEIIATDEVRGKVTLKLDGVPWEDALEVIARSLGLDVQRVGKLIRVTSAARAEADREARERSESMRTELYHLRFARASYLAELLTGERTHLSRSAGGGFENAEDVDFEGGGRPNRPSIGAVPKLPVAAHVGVLSQRGSAIADEPSNTLIITDVQRGLEAARQIIAEIDRPAPQVEIESEIIETSHDFGRSLGVQWGYRYTASGLTGNPTGFNFPASIGFGGAPNLLGSNGLNSGVDPLTGALIPFMADFPAAAFGAGHGGALDLTLGSLDQSQLLDIRLTQLEQQDKIKIISRPRIITRNNQEATIKSVDIARVRLPASTIIGGYGFRNYGVATESIEVGILLKVRPQVSSDGYILLDLTAVSSSLLPNQQVDNIPIQEERATESHVLLRDGQTLVVGGIYRLEHSTLSQGIPFLRAVPGLGWLFGGIQQKTRRQDLIIFITPRRVATEVEVGTQPLPPARQLWLNRTTSGG